MGSDLTPEKKKEAIKKKLEETYNNSKGNCNSIYELDTYIDASLTTEMLKYIEDLDIKSYFNAEKKKKFDEFSKELIKKETEKANNLQKELLDKTIEFQNKIKESEEKNKEQIEKDRKEQNEKFEQILNMHSKNIQEMKEQSNAQLLRFERERKEYEKESKRTIEAIQKKYEQERKDEEKKKLLEEKKKLEELNTKIENITKKFNEKVEILKSNKIKKIINEFKLKEDNFCKEEISKFDIEKIRTLIKALYKNENILSQILSNLNLFIDKVKNKVNTVDHLNIILVGPCGVGKSTLINTILELNVQTKTGFGQPQTQEIKEFESETIPFLRLIDSKGIEKNELSGVTATYNSIKNCIKERLETNNPDKFIHCIWYCWTGTRLESSEIALLKKLSQEYTLSTLPVIIVYTNAIDPTQTEAAKDYIYNKLELTNEFVDVLSVEKEIFGVGKIPPRNLDKLKEISIKQAMSAINSSCFEGLAKEIKCLIKETLNNLTADLKDNIDLDMQSTTEKMNEKSTINDLYGETIKLIFNIFYKFVFLDPQAKITDLKNPKIKLNNKEYPTSSKSINDIKRFVIDYFKEALNIYQKKIDEIISKYSKELATEIITFQLEFNQQNDNLLKVQWTSLELEKVLYEYIYDSFSKKAEIALLKNSFSFISTPIIARFKEYFETSYNQGMEQKKFKEAINKIIKVPFDNIERKIKQYNECMRKKMEEKEKALKNQPVAPTPNDKQELKDNEKKTDKPTPADLTASELEGMWDDAGT